MKLTTNAITQIGNAYDGLRAEVYEPGNPDTGAGLHAVEITEDLDGTAYVISWRDGGMPPHQVVTAITPAGVIDSLGEDAGSDWLPFAADL